MRSLCCNPTCSGVKRGLETAGTAAIVGTTEVEEVEETVETLEIEGTVTTLVTEGGEGL
jgi:hypothetical protein